MNPQDSQTITADLKPCPFCGGEAAVRTYQDESLWSHNIVTKTQVGCDNCDYSFATEPGYEIEALELWNTRDALNQGQGNEPVGQFDTSDYVIVGLDGKPRRNEPVGVTLPRQLHFRHQWAQPGDEEHRTFILRFSDPDCREQVFTGEDAEQRAYDAWNLYSPSWNVYLFGTVPLSASITGEKG